MSQSGGQRSGRILKTVRSHRAAAVRLPEPSREWECADVDDVLAEKVNLFSRRDIIKIVKRDSVRGYVWRTRPEAYAQVERVRAEEKLTPCGHAGVRNLGDGEFTCTTDACEETFGREAAEEVLGG